MNYPITLDRERNLRYGMKAVSQIEKKLGKAIGAIDMNQLPMADMAVFIWAGLTHEDAKLTPEKVMDLVDEYSSVKEISKAMGEAMKLAFGGDGEPDDEKNA